MLLFYLERSFLLWQHMYDFSSLKVSLECFFNVDIQIDSRRKVTQSVFDQFPAVIYRSLLS